jgi:hypothetical protein
MELSETPGAMPRAGGVLCTPAQPRALGEVADVCWHSHFAPSTVHYRLRRLPAIPSSCLPAQSAFPRLSGPQWTKAHGVRRLSETRAHLEQNVDKPRAVVVKRPNRREVKRRLQKRPRVADELLRVVQHR